MFNCRRTLVGAMAFVLVTGLPLAALGQGPEELRAMTFTPIPGQKVVYQVTEGEGWLVNRGYDQLVLGTARNHVAAVGAANLDLRIVLAGNGLHLLQHALGDANLRQKIDALKADGVRFLVCRNTLLNNKIDADRDLYGVSRDDIVQAGVAEVSALQARGFAYVRP